MKNSCQVKYPLSLYKIESLKIAKNDYRDICNISISVENDYAICTFEDSIYDNELTAMEFSNYLLEILNSRSKQC